MYKRKKEQIRVLKSANSNTNLLILNHDHKHRPILVTVRLIWVGAIIRMIRECAGWPCRISIGNGWPVFTHCLTLPGDNPSSPLNHLKHKWRIFTVTFLISPMRCKSKLSLQMHLLCPNLNFKWNHSFPHNYRVQRLIPVSYEIKVRKENINTYKITQPLLSYYRPVELGTTYVVLELPRYFRP